MSLFLLRTPSGARRHPVMPANRVPSHQFTFPMTGTDKVQKFIMREAMIANLKR